MSSRPERYRLITRSDFDGLVCAMLFKEMDILDGIKFVHPKDVQDGKIKVTDTDILTNLPFVAGCHLCFDHHDSEEIRSGDQQAENHILAVGADSAARVVYDYYGGAQRYPKIDAGMMDAVDKADSARFSRSDILDPQGWVLLSFLMDARTGLGWFRDFRLSNYELMMNLIDDCKQFSIDEVLAMPDVAERVELYNAHREPFCDQIGRCSTIQGKVVVLDLREEETIYAGNRFMIYALYPETNSSIHVIWGLKNQKTVLAIGKSILNHSNPHDVSEIVLKYGGGGHAASGTCQIAHGQSDLVLREIVAKLNTEVHEPVTA